MNLHVITREQPCQALSCMFSTAAHLGIDICHSLCVISGQQAAHSMRGALGDAESCAASRLNGGLGALRKPSTALLKRHPNKQEKPGIYVLVLLHGDSVITFML